MVHLGAGDAQLEQIRVISSDLGVNLLCVISEHKRDVSGVDGSVDKLVNQFFSYPSASLGC